MNDSNETAQPRKLLRLKGVTARTGLSRSTIYSLMDPKCSQYDPTFPKRIYLTFRTVAWVESEVVAWIEKKMQTSRAA